MNRVAVLYHYFEKDQVYRDNLVFFLSRAWRPDLDFFVVIAGACSVDLPQHPNIRYTHTANYGHDFGGYGDVAASGALDAYDHLVFVNCSVRGPFLPDYCSTPWTEPFLNLLTGDVHLSGATINILHDDRKKSREYAQYFPDATPPFIHVQSFAYAMTAACFAFLRSHSVFESSRNQDRHAAIVACEIGISQRVLANGWNISCVLPPYRGIDYRTLRHDINPATRTGHPQAPGAYFGRTPHPYELIFVKPSLQPHGADDLAFHSLMALAHHPVPTPAWPEADELVQRLRHSLASSIGQQGTPHPLWADAG